MFNALKVTSTFLKATATIPTNSTTKCILKNLGVHKHQLSTLSLMQFCDYNVITKRNTGNNNYSKIGINENVFSTLSKRNFGASAGRNLPTRINAEDELFGYTGQPGARVVKRRLPGSVYKMNMVSKMVVGMKVDEALTQLEYLQKRRARPVHRAINNAVNLCSILHDLKPEELYVSGAYVGKGSYKKLLRFRGRGKVNIERRPNCRLTVVVRKDTRLLKEKHPRLAKKKRKRKLGGVSATKTM
jgi:ribosomal protein L22